MFIDMLGYGEIALKSDTEPAIVAFRNRVAETCMLWKVTSKQTASWSVR